MENKDRNKVVDKERLDIMSGQLAVIVNDNQNNSQTIPLKLSNNSKEVINVGIKHKNEVVWGTPFGHWMRMPTQNDHTVAHKTGIGLNVLTAIEDLFVTEFVNIFRDINQHKHTNYYLVKNIKSENVFLAKQSVNFKAKSISGVSQQTDIKFMDGFNREVLFSRQLIHSCLTNNLVMEVMVQPSKKIGFIYINSHEYTIKDQKGSVLLRIDAPKNKFCCKSRSSIGPFHIYSADNSKLGVIHNKKSEKKHFKESFLISANFPLGLDVLSKATIVAVMFLIKSLY